MIDLSGVAQVSGKTRCGIRATPNKSLVTTFNKHFSGRRVRGSPQQPVQGEVQAVRGRGQQLQPLRLQQLDLHRLGQPQVESELKSRPPSAVVAASSAPSPGGGWDNRAPDLINLCFLCIRNRLFWKNPQLGLAPVRCGFGP